MKALKGIRLSTVRQTVLMFSLFRCRAVRPGRLPQYFHIPLGAMHADPLSIFDEPRSIFHAYDGLIQTSIHRRLLSKDPL